VSTPYSGPIRVRDVLAELVRSVAVRPRRMATGYEEVLALRSRDALFDVAHALSNPTRRRGQVTDRALKRIKALLDGRSDLDGTVTAQTAAQVDAELGQVVKACVDEVEALAEFGVNHGSAPASEGLNKSPRAVRTRPRRRLPTSGKESRK